MPAAAHSEALLRFLERFRNEIQSWLDKQVSIGSQNRWTRKLLEDAIFPFTSPQHIPIYCKLWQPAWYVTTKKFFFVIVPYDIILSNNNTTINYTFKFAYQFPGKQNPDL